jgi:integrase
MRQEKRGYVPGSASKYPAVHLVVYLIRLLTTRLRMGHVAVLVRIPSFALVASLPYTAQAWTRIVTHDLRRAFAKLAMKGSARLEQIQLSLGHS